MNDWEMHEWAGIEQDLAADSSFARDFALPSRWETRRLACRRYFYPGGYLGCVVLYMVFAMGGALVGIVGGALLAGMLTWTLVEARTSLTEHKKTGVGWRIGAS